MELIKEDKNIIHEGDLYEHIKVRRKNVGAFNRKKKIFVHLSYIQMQSL